MSPDELSSAWSKHATAYARTFAPLTGHLARSLFALVEARLPAPARVLDIACGAGELSVAAARHLRRVEAESGVRGEVVATDFASVMVDLTGAALTALGAGSLAQVQVMDGQNLSFPDASFDAAFSSFGIFLFPDRLAGWREAARVLKPGGLFATTVWRGPEHHGLAHLQRELLAVALPERLKTEFTPPAWWSLVEAEALVAEITSSAPLARATVTVLNATLVVPSPHELWQGMLHNPVSSGLLRDLTPTELRAAEQVILGRLEELAGGADQPVRIDASCHAVVAVRA